MSLRFRFTLSNSVLGSQVLSSEPKGWSEIEIHLERTKDYLGVLSGISREQIVKLEFYPGAGKEFIDEVRSTQGVDAVINITIQISSGGGFEDLYLGELDLKTYEAEGVVGTRDSFCSVKIIERGIFEKVKSRLDTKVDLARTTSLDGVSIGSMSTSPYDLNLESKVIQYSTLFREDGEFTNPYTRNFNVLQNTVYSGPFYYNAPFSLIYSEFGEHNENTEPLYTSRQNFFEADSTDDLTIEYNITFEFTEMVDDLPRGYDYALVVDYGSSEVVLTNGGVYFNLTEGTTTPVFLIDPITVSGSFTITGVSIGTGISLAFKIKDIHVGDGGGIHPDSDANVTVEWGADSYIKISKNTTTTDTVSKSWLAHEAGAKISQIITDQTDAFRSTLFGGANSEPNTYSENGCFRPTAIMPGFWVRGFDIEEKPFSLSMNDFIQGFSPICNLGWGIEEGGSGYVIRVEKRDYFFDSNTVIMRIPRIPSWTIREAPELYWNDIEIGYDKWSVENINGLDEFNSKRQYTYKYRVINNTIKPISRFIAGGYILETTRRVQMGEQATTDTEYDNDIFVICLDRSDKTFPEHDENLADSLNVLSPETSYNFRISPARNFLRWMNVFNGGVTKSAGREIEFTYGVGNYDLITQFTSDSCPGNYNNASFSESQDIQWDGSNTGATPIWIPEVYEFDYPLSFSEYKTLKSIGSDGKLNAYKCIEVSRSNENFIKCFILDIFYKPTKGLATFKLLRANT